MAKNLKYVLRELLEEADVVLVIVADIVDALKDHGNALDSHAEGVTGVDFRVDADGLKDLGVNHAAAHNFEPLVAQLTEVGREEVHLKARLREWEEARAQACLGLRAEDCFNEVIEGGLEVEQRNVLIDVEAFDLVEIRTVRGVRRITAEAATRSDDTDRRFLFQHCADLHG